MVYLVHRGPSLESSVKYRLRHPRGRALALLLLPHVADHLCLLLAFGKGVLLEGVGGDLGACDLHDGEVGAPKNVVSLNLVVPPLLLLLLQEERVGAGEGPGVRLGGRDVRVRVVGDNAAEGGFLDGGLVADEAVRLVGQRRHREGLIFIIIVGVRRIHDRGARLGLLADRVVELVLPLLCKPLGLESLGGLTLHRDLDGRALDGAAVSEAQLAQGRPVYSENFLRLAAHCVCFQ